MLTVTAVQSNSNLGRKLSKKATHLNEKLQNLRDKAITKAFMKSLQCEVLGLSAATVKPRAIVRPGCDSSSCGSGGCGYGMSGPSVF